MSNSGLQDVQNESTVDFDESEIVSSSIQQMLFKYPHSAAARTARPVNTQKSIEPTAEEIVASILDPVEVVSEKAIKKTKTPKTKIAPAVEVVSSPVEVVAEPAKTVCESARETVCEAVVETVVEPTTEPVAEAPKKKKKKKSKVEPVAPAVEVSVTKPVAQSVAEIRKVAEAGAVAKDEVEILVAELESDEIASAAQSGGFHELGLRDEVRQAVEKSGYSTPTPIQIEIIPLMLAGRDLLAQSETGSGKTAAFALPILSQIDATSRKTQVLVLAPTRELAIQVAN